MADKYAVVFKDFDRGRQWDLAQAPVDNADTGYIVDMLNRMAGDGAEWLVKFCRLVCTAVDEVKGESDEQA